MAEKLLEIQHVSKIFRIGGMLMGKKLVAIDDVSLDIDAGKPVILSIVGESGCGKSTPVSYTHLFCMNCARTGKRAPSPS